MSNDDPNRPDDFESPEEKPSILDQFPPMAVEATPFLVVRRLFSVPSLGLFLAIAGRRWILPFILICLIMGLGSCAKAIAEYKHYSVVAGNVAQAVAPGLAPFELHDGHLAWSETAGKSYSKAVEGWHIGARRMTLAEFDKDKRAALEMDGHPTVPRGILLLNDGVIYWNNDGMDYQFSSVISKAHLAKLEKNLNESQLNGKLDAEQFRSFVALMCIISIPGVAILFFGVFMGTALFCCIVFGLSAIIFRRDLLKRFGDGFIIGINACLPAALISMVWYWVAPLDWDFQTVFYLAFIAYLLIAYFDSRRVKIAVNRIMNEDVMDNILGDDDAPGNEANPEQGAPVDKDEHRENEEGGSANPADNPDKDEDEPDTRKDQ